MSAKAMAWALDQTTDLPVDKLILIAIGNFADEHNQCFPSRKTLARIGMCSLDSVDRAVKRLIDGGLVEKAERTGTNGKTTSNCYTLAVAGKTTTATTDSVASRKLRPMPEPVPAAPVPPSPQPQFAAIPAAPNAAPPAAMLRPQSESSIEPTIERVSETHAGHGVFVNCETIRHSAFTISLPAIRLGTQASGLDAEAIKTHCIAHALQWAAEIEAGKLSDTVVPSKIANFLSASIMGATNRKAAADTRRSRQPDGKPAKKTVMQILAEREAAGATQ